MTQLFGPLRHLWCLRFEAKHQFFKRLACIVYNFKNISKTLAHRHQMQQCWESTSLGLDSEPEMGKHFEIKGFPNNLQTCLLSLLNGNIGQNIKKNGHSPV